MMEHSEIPNSGSGRLAYNPKKLSVVGLTNHNVIGNAMRIMLRAAGFGTVEISSSMEVCFFGGKIKPTFILFAPESLSLKKDPEKDLQCPCSKRKNCNYTLTVIFLKNRTFDHVLMAKEMGFDGIIFADEPLEKIQASLKRIYEKNLGYEL